MVETLGLDSRVWEGGELRIRHRERDREKIKVLCRLRQRGWWRMMARLVEHWKGRKPRLIRE